MFFQGFILRILFPSNSNLTFSIFSARVYLVPSKLDLTQSFQNLTSDSIYDLKWDLMNRFLDFQATNCKPSKWTGKCDPKSPEMIAWFEKKRMRKRLEAWGEMIVFWVGQWIL